MHGWHLNSLLLRSAIMVAKWRSLTSSPFLADQGSTIELSCSTSLQTSHQH